MRVEAALAPGAALRRRLAAPPADAGPALCVEARLQTLSARDAAELHLADNRICRSPAPATDP